MSADRKSRAVAKGAETASKAAAMIPVSVFIWAFLLSSLCCRWAGTAGRHGSLHLRCEVKRYNRTTLVALCEGVEWIWVFDDGRRSMPCPGGKYRPPAG